MALSKKEKKERQILVGFPIAFVLVSLSMSNIEIQPIMLLFMAFTGYYLIYVK